MKNYNRIKNSSYFFVLLVNFFSLFWYTQGKPDGVDVADRPVDMTADWVYLTQRVLGGIIIFHGLAILSFDIYRDMPVVSEARRLKGFWYSVYTLFLARENIVYYIFYIGLAALGIYIPAFYSFLMNDILNINTILKNLVKSVWRPRSSIVLTLILFLVIMYAFAAIGFVGFSKEYANSMPNKQACTNIFQCFLLTLDKGTKFDGAIGNYLDDHNENLDESGNYIPVSITKFIFSNLLLILNFIIVLSIVTGIIIDTFGSLREEYNSYIEDTESFCFICGHDREMLDKESEEKEGFDYHVRNEHYQWNYLFYIGYLTDKQDTEHTGLESYIAGLIVNERIDWFPNHRAMMIKEEDGLEAGEALDENIEDIENNVGFRSLSMQISTS